MGARKTLITYDHVVEFLKNRLAQPPCGNDHDFLPMLEEGSVTFKVSMDAVSYTHLTLPTSDLV